MGNHLFVIFLHLFVYIRLFCDLAISLVVYVCSNASQTPVIFVHHPSSLFTFLLHRVEQKTWLPLAVGS